MFWEKKQCGQYKTKIFVRTCFQAVFYHVVVQYLYEIPILCRPSALSEIATVKVMAVSRNKTGGKRGPAVVLCVCTEVFIRDITVKRGSAVPRKREPGGSDLLEHQQARRARTHARGDHRLRKGGGNKERTDNTISYRLFLHPFFHHPPRPSFRAKGTEWTLHPKHNKPQ